jgi:hypothetical protein
LKFNGPARDEVPPVYNIQTAIDTEHALIVTHAVVLERLIPFDTYNMFYRDAVEQTRLGPLRDEAMAVRRAMDRMSRYAHLGLRSVENTGLGIGETVIPEKRVFGKLRPGETPVHP